MGAAGYVVKPFSPTERAARIRAALRRRDVPAPYVLGGPDGQLCRAPGDPGRSSGPADRQGVRDAGRAFGQRRAGADLRASARRVWGLEGDSDGEVRRIRTVISSLRQKLGDAAENPTYIFTELRVGYRMPKGERPEQRVTVLTSPRSSAPASEPTWKRQCTSSRGHGGTLLGASAQSNQYTFKCTPQPHRTRLYVCRRYSGTGHAPVTQRMRSILTLCTETFLVQYRLAHLGGFEPCT